MTIAHEEIKGFMSAMTMPFHVSDQDSLDGVKPGDEVEATLHVVRENDVVSEYELRGLTVIKPAIPRDGSRRLQGKSKPPRTAKAAREGRLVPDFLMTTQEGKSLRLSDLRGNVVAITFIYTRCPLPDFCPLMDRKFGELASRIECRPGTSAANSPDFSVV